MVDDRSVYDHNTGERLSPHWVKVVRQTEHDATTRRHLFERVPIVMARGKKVRCQWVDEMKHGANGPFVRSRLVAIHSLALHPSNASRSSSQELRQSRTREENTHVCLHVYDISVSFWHALLPEDEPDAMCPPPGYMWQMFRAMCGTETSITSLPGTHEGSSQRSRIRSTHGMSPSLSLP